jgi:Zn-dependent peptidase ImmA (M78 family)
MQLTTIPNIQRTTTYATIRGRGYDPWHHAEQLGIEVIETPLKTCHGLWVPDHNAILLHSRLRYVYKRTVLTHEIGHAVHGHEDDTPKNENQADKFAAYHLIDPDELAGLLDVSPDEQNLIAELGVTTRLFRSYVMHHHQRMEWPRCEVA